MNNKQIAAKFNLLGKLMELHGENKFKTRSYTNAYMAIKKHPQAIIDISEEDLQGIPGIGKTIQTKILELISTGNLSALQKYIELTPAGIVEMLGIKGLGPKKVEQLWKELGLESPGELLYACNENRLVDLKGFGTKTQASVKAQIEYYLVSKGKYHFATLEVPGKELLAELEESFPEEQFAFAGELARQCQIVNQIEILGTVPSDSLDHFMNDDDEFEFKGYVFEYIESDFENFGTVELETSADQDYLAAFNLVNMEGAQVEDIYADAGIDFHPAYLREKENIAWLKEKPFDESQLIHDKAIKGVVHNHSTYSDGVNTVLEMAQQTEKLGYDYLVMTDHSKSAFYANGLQVERLLSQIEEIKALNLSQGLRVFTGIESDILNNGDLDYEPEILKSLDVVVASVHSVLKMDENRATERLVKAIENPYTKILGHPTGRLLLSRQGYPVNFEKVIDACAANGVVIEMNANPYRLDMDWRFIQQAMDKGVMISINPDAHSIAGIEDIHYGVCAARKGGLTIDMCLNTKGLKEFEAWLESK